LPKINSRLITLLTVLNAASATANSRNFRIVGYLYGRSIYNTNY